MNRLTLACVLSLAATVCSCSEDDDSEAWYWPNGPAPVSGAGGSAAIAVDAGLAYACPDLGSAFILDQGQDGSSTTVTAWYPQRWCEQDSDCGNDEVCFFVTADRGLCSSPQGVSCSDFAATPQFGSGTVGSDAASDAGGATDASVDSGAADASADTTLPAVVTADAGNIIACDAGAECFYDKADGFLTPAEQDTVTAMCAANGCRSDADCEGSEICVPGWVGPRSSNTCMVPGCRSDADCAHARCGMCAFVQLIGWPFDSSPVVSFMGSACL